MEIIVKQCMICRYACVHHDGDCKTVFPPSGHLIVDAELVFCQDCSSHANLLVNTYAKVYGYANA